MSSGHPAAQAEPGDDVSAREAGDSHAATAETIEQSVATESHPSEDRQRPDPDSGDVQDQ